MASMLQCDAGSIAKINGLASEERPMHRRQVLHVGLAALASHYLPAHARVAAGATLSGQTMSPLNRDEPPGSLMIIGGAEDRTGEKKILRRFIELTGRDDPQIAVLPAASAFPDFVWGRYDRVFEELGIRRRMVIALNSPEDCNDPRVTETILQSDGIFLSGGDQRRLAALINGTGVERAIHRAYHQRGACIAGTSAGASVMSRHMLAGRGISDGIGLLPNAIIDQHFSERRRLARLVSFVASTPSLIGIGVDEDTALIISRLRSVEVVGAGGVTVVDARRLPHPVNDADPEQLLQLPEIEIHLLPNGVSSRHTQGGPKQESNTLPGLPDEQAVPPALHDMLVGLASA